jgi:hypothetical protein
VLKLGFAHLSGRESLPLNKQKRFAETVRVGLCLTALLQGKSSDISHWKVQQIFGILLSCSIRTGCALLFMLPCFFQSSRKGESRLQPVELSNRFSPKEALGVVVCRPTCASAFSQDRYGHTHDSPTNMGSLVYKNSKYPSHPLASSSFPSQRYTHVAHKPFVENYMLWTTSLLRETANSVSDSGNSTE